MIKICLSEGIKFNAMIIFFFSNLSNFSDFSIVIPRHGFKKNLKFNKLIAQKLRLKVKKARRTSFLKLPNLSIDVKFNFEITSLSITTTNKCFLIHFQLEYSYNKTISYIYLLPVNTKT